MTDMTPKTAHKSIKTDVLVSPTESMSIEAFESGTDGLVVHKQVKWSPGKEEHKFTSKWQVTHQPSGKALLTPNRCFDRQKDAFKFARRLRAIRDWNSMTADALSEDTDAMQSAKNIHEGVMREKEAEDAGEILVDEEYESSYTIRRNRETRMYDVVDSNTDEVVSSHPHRGLAWKEAHRLNQDDR